MMKKELIVLSICVIGLFGACISDKKEPVVMNQIERNFDQIRADIVKGDTLAYNEFKDYYIEFEPSNFLFYSMFMANQYNYDKAYLDVYYCFKDDYTGLKFYERDKKTQEIILYYLKEAVRRKVDGAEAEFNQLELVKPKTVKEDN